MRASLAILIAGFGLAAGLDGQAPLSRTTGEHRQLVMPVYFRGQALEQAALAAADAEIAARADRHAKAFATWSYGRLRWTNTLLPHLRLDIDPSCDHRALVGAASRALEGSGWNPARLAPYLKVVEISMHHACMSKGGESGVGGRVQVLYRFLNSWEHETAHGLGLPHSFRRVCDATGACTLTAQPNEWSIMQGRPNAPEKIRLGWLTDAEVLDLPTGAASATYVLGNLAQPLDHRRKALRIPLPDESNAHGFRWLFVEAGCTIGCRAVIHAGMAPNNQWWLIGEPKAGETVTFAGLSIDVLAANAVETTVRLSHVLRSGTRRSLGPS